MDILTNILFSVKALAKAALLSRPCSRINGMAEGKRILILANGPSLSDTIRNNSVFLKSAPSLAIDWKMTLFVPVKFKKAARALYGNKADLKTFNNIGAEGLPLITHFLFRVGAAMPRPRNVLIPSLMLAINMGYKEIIIFGADHSWMKTLSVTDENEVVSIQPHFYKDGEDEQNRIRHEYRNYRLHQIVESFAIAFKSYHDIANFADSKNVKIFNSTPGSFIDAFERRPVSELENHI